METIELSRSEFHSIIWSTPLSKLTQMYAYNNDGIKKICKEFEIPMPDYGYWIKLKFNKKVITETLNSNYSGNENIKLTIRVDGNPINVNQTPLTIRTKEIENDPKAPLIVQSKITKPDLLTVQTKEHWINRKKANYIKDKNKITYPIRVSDAHKERALCFMDSLMKLLRYRGHTISIEYHYTCVLINGIFIEMDLREASKRVPAKHPFSGTELEPIGEFIFKMGKYSGEKEWRDGKIKIESMLAKIVAKLEIYAEQEKIRKEESRIYWLEYEENKKRLEEIKKHKEEELKKFNILLKNSEQYNNAKLIRQYIEAEKQKAIAENNLTTEKQDWIKWANDKADWYDPTINKPDDLLDT